MTYSIVARDSETGQLGVGVASHVLACGAVAPWAEPEVGVVATQAFVEIGYGPKMLAAMRQVAAPEVALSELVAADPMATTRQIAALDTTGRVSVHTGTQCIREAGHRTGDGFACQANMMRDPGVPEAMAEAFPSAGSLTRRLLATLEAAEAAGGDIRGRQSAAIKVVSGRLGGPMNGWLVDLRVDDHPQPLTELRRLVELHEAGNPSAHDGPARQAELGRGNPEGWFWRGVTLANEGQLDEARAALAHAFAVSDDWRELLRRIPALLPRDPSVFRQLVT